MNIISKHSAVFKMISANIRRTSYEEVSIKCYVISRVFSDKEEYRSQ